MNSKLAFRTALIRRIAVVDMIILPCAFAPFRPRFHLQTHRQQTKLILLANRNAFLHSVHLLQSKKQRLRSQLAMTLRLHSNVELVRESQTREREIHSLRLIQGNAHVLDEVLHEEAGIEVANHHARSQIVDAPRPSSARTHSSNHLVEIQARLVAVDQTLAHANLHHNEAQTRTMLVAIRIWLHIFVCCPQPAFPMYFRFVPMHWRSLAIHTKYLEERSHLLENLLVASNHDAKLRVTSTHITARHCVSYTHFASTWCVQRSNALLLSSLVDLHSQRRLAGGHIHDNAAFLEITLYIHPYLHSSKNALLAEIHLADVLGESTVHTMP